MAKRSKKQTAILGRSLSGGDSPCPIPTTHDKLSEAHFFIHEMLDAYHEPNPFRYRLSAFFQAADSTLDILRKIELQNQPKARAWLDTQRHRFDDDDLQKLHELRKLTVHLQALLPHSTAFIGAFKYDRLKMGFSRMPMSPTESSLPRLMHLRNRCGLFGITPHRIFDGEDIGIQRTWRHEQTGEEELVTFCIRAWEKIGKIVEDAHSVLGAQFDAVAKCKHFVEEHRTLREFQVFSEVAKIWELGYVTEEVEPLGQELKLYEYPADDAQVLHTVSAGTSIRGWVGDPSTMWSTRFVSMVVEKIGTTEIDKDTCIYFEHARARITSLDHAEEGQSGESPED
jgi:hypothetical protein